MKGVQEDSLIAIDLHRAKYTETLLHCYFVAVATLRGYIDLFGKHHDGRSLKLACNGFGL